MTHFHKNTLPLVFYCSDEKLTKTRSDIDNFLAPNYLSIRSGCCTENTREHGLGARSRGVCQS